MPPALLCDRPAFMPKLSAFLYKTVRHWNATEPQVYRAERTFTDRVPGLYNSDPWLSG
ncbi:MAG: hypothetical protein IPO90_09750 [Flavobacteriales bacterium]|nr:hypothetical protein [Flavobacteriales bacterium]